ncbi:MAG: YdcF family protein, partial [Anaerovoracaceae bacterium]|nr:YdcF family protein [Anaerovoracaceae bacterium]
MCILAAVAAVIVLGINFIVVGMGGRDLVSEKDMLKESSFRADCIIVLGAQVKADGTPSKMLRDRLDEGIRLYEAGAAPKILMSGDDG